MNRARVIMIGSNLADEHLAKLIRQAIADGYAVSTRAAGECNLELSRTHDPEKVQQLIKDREFHQNRASDLLHIANDVVAPRTATYAMMEVSTCHITQDDSEILAYMCECNVKDQSSPLNVGNFGYGYAVMLMVDPENDEDLDLGIRQEECLASGNNLSPAFWNVLRTAKAGGYRCVYFDCDAEEHEDFERFEW